MTPLESKPAPGLPRADRRALARGIRAKRHAIAKAILTRSVRRSEINVGLELTALSFADRFADAVAAGNWTLLMSWVDDVCSRYRDFAVVPRLLSTGTSIVANQVSDLAAICGSPAEIALVAEEIERIASRPRAAAALTADTLDEIDVVLGELVSRLEASDPLTAEHSRAVSVWCARISKRMSLSRSEITYISRCGLIHDIGKITTPLDILTAPRKLTDAEMNMMRRHAEDGSAIIMAIPLLAHHNPAVRGHHERLDGRGYPDGLPASRIPLSARIVAVADSFNAMIANRPYRLPMRPTLALEELRVHTGTQFDPDVVAAMNDVLAKHS